MQDQQIKTDVKRRAYYFAIEVIKFVETLPNQRIFWIICDQLLRSATSIGANIVEAKAASSKRDFIKYFEIALKSANETLYWLCLLRDSTSADKNQIQLLLKENQEICKLLGASLLTMKNKRNR